MHSWRLLIKPYLDATPTYMMYDFSQPWDAPSNKKLMADSWEFRCPADKNFSTLDSTTANYVAVVGRNAAWRRPKDVSRSDHNQQEHAADTFLVIELGDSRIPWTEPKDVRSDDVEALRSLAAHGPHRRSNGYFFRETPGVNAVLVDGDWIFMFPCDSTPNILSSLLPPNEKTTSDKDSPLNHFYTEQLQLNWPHCIGLPLWMVSAGLLFYRVASSRPSSGGHSKSPSREETKERTRANGMDLS